MNSFRKQIRFRKQFLRLLLFFSIGSLCVISFLRLALFPDRHKNYFLDLENVNDIGLVVNTSSCRIPNFSPSDPAVIPFVKQTIPNRGLHCAKQNHNWSSLVGNELIIHKNHIYEDGYYFNPDFCCYKVIERVEESLSNYTQNADDLIKYSSCIRISQERTIITGAEFIQVECNREGDTTLVDNNEQGIFSISAIKMYHGSALTKDIEAPTKKATSKEILKKPSLLSKLIHWKEQKALRIEKASEEFLPPNILLIGQNSVSRLNFRRNMIKTTQVLESLGAVEMLGYVKVGESSFPNLRQILSGYPEGNLRHLCRDPDMNKLLDYCPFIFRLFDEANYLTAFIEDAPAKTTLNSKRMDFVNQPVDFYGRSLFLAAYHSRAAQSRKLNCVGPQTNDQAILNYLESTLELAHRNSSPLFAFSLSTTATLTHTEQLLLSDSTYAEFLQRIEDKGHLKNTILFVFGDHGYLQGSIRETLVGHYEDRLPNMWIRLPPKLKEKYSDWQEALEANSARLSSPQVLFWTLQTVLKEFSPGLQPFVDEITHEGETIPRPPVRYNFFEEIPEDTSCEDLSIPEQFCPCTAINLKPIANLKEPILFKAVEYILNFINTNVLKGTECSKLALVKVTTGAYSCSGCSNQSSRIEVTTVKNLEEERIFGVARYIIGFITTPGEFRFEADINYFEGNSTFSSYPHVQRVNDINVTRIICAPTSEVQPFCFCPK